MDIYLYQNAIQSGPFPEEAIAEFLRSGEISADTYAWHEGLEEWKVLPVLFPALFSAAPIPQAGAWRIIRVFISSTFRDMHAERDHLVTVVFPELRERVELLGLEFFDVDLRWGVPAKDPNGETANSWEYCRQWIDRVEPFFVCILGQRYGWVPEPNHFRDTADRQRQEREPRSITDLEVRHAVLDTLRKRRSYFYLRATPVPEPNAEYVDPPEYQGRLEALKTAVRHCGRPVRNYSPEWTGQGFVGLKKFGDYVLGDLWSGVLRDERYVPKAVWRRVLNADPDSDLRYTDESQPVPRELWEKIVALAKPPPQDPLDAERRQMEAFAATRLHLFQGRTHELHQLTNFIHSTAESAPRLAVVAAAPGQGKSALIAKLHQQLSLGTPPHPPAQTTARPASPSNDGGEAIHPPLPSAGEGQGEGKPLFLITHFVGATERSAAAHALVQRLLDELDRSGIEWPVDEVKEGEEPKRDFDSLCNRLRKRLGEYAGDGNIVILLDALNQLTYGHDLHWLPGRLGLSVRVIVSCLDDSNAKEGSPECKVFRALESRQPKPLRVPLGPLSENDVRTIVVEILKEYCKELDREHLDAICRMAQAKNPLYLLVMLGELRKLGGNDMNRIVGECIAALPHDFPDTVALFRWVLQRLEVFGLEAVRCWCLYLAHGRVGMVSYELADLLARKLDPNAASIAMLIERGLRRYLLRRGGQLDFFHGQLRQAVMEQYASHAAAVAVHGELADYFTACAKGTDSQKEWETGSFRGFSECVFHLTKAEQYDQAAVLLSNFSFLLHKVRVGLLEGAFEDYDMFRREVPAEAAKPVEIWADFFREKAHILRRGNDEWPAHKILLQLAAEHADDSPLTIGAERWLAKGRCDWLWLRRVPRPPRTGRDPCIAVLEGHSGMIMGALALADGRLLSWSLDTTLRLWHGLTGECLAVLEGHSHVYGALALADGRLLSWDIKTLRLWDGLTGECLAVLEGHSYVNGALALADGRLLSWGNKTLRLWDGLTGQCLAVLEGHSEGISGVLVLADNRLLFWAPRNHTLQLWNARNGRRIAVLEGHSGPVRGALALADGRLLSWSEDKTLRLWNARKGRRIAVLEGHSGTIWGALALADGRLLSWSEDKTLRLWNARNGRRITVLEGHSGPVWGALALADGRLLSWSVDKTLRLWHGLTGECLAVLEGHSEKILDALALAGGRLVSWSEDKTLRLWAGLNGQCLAVLKGHSEKIFGVLALADGRLLSWANDETLRLWDGRAGECLAVLEGHSRTIRRVLALADGRLVSWSLDKTLRIWDASNGQCIAVLEAHSDDLKGALALADGKLLSWELWGHALRLWDGLTGQCLAVLKGHSGPVRGALALADGRLLSWANDETLRLWDARDGQCLAVLEGHFRTIRGALALADDRLLSWSEDETLRSWDGLSGQCLAVLKGHSGPVTGALVLADGRLLSWGNKTLRLWDGLTGQCLAVLDGHSGGVDGVLEFADGKLLSWSLDKTLRIWDASNGQCIAVLQGHSWAISGALALADGRLLSWSPDKTVRIWDADNGQCLATITENEIGQFPPEWLHSYLESWNLQNMCGYYYADSLVRSARLRHFIKIPNILATWNADSNAASHVLSPDGTTVVTQANGQVCILKLQHGNRRVSLFEAEALLTK